MKLYVLIDTQPIDHRRRDLGEVATEPCLIDGLHGDQPALRHVEREQIDEAEQVLPVQEGGFLRLLVEPPQSLLRDLYTHTLLAEVLSGTCLA